MFGKDTNVNFMCLDAPLFAYQVFIATILVERQDTIEKSFSNLVVN